jgi:hypothetical protein
MCLSPSDLQVSPIQNLQRKLSIFLALVRASDLTPEIKYRHPKNGKDTGLEPRAILLVAEDPPDYSG